MTARIARRSAVVLAALISAAVFATCGYLFWSWATSPIVLPDPPQSRPLPASTAAPAPLTPVVLTDLPAHQRGPQALHATTTSSETPR